MIPESAVEAALETSLRQLGLWGKDLPVGLLDARRDSVRELLKAAAPHLMARAWDEGHEEGWLNRDDGMTEPEGRKRNPHR